MPSSALSGIRATVSIQPGSTRSTDDVRGRLGGPELEPRVEEVGRAVLVGDGPDRLGEQVQPGRVHAAAQRQVGVEPAAVAERVALVEAHHDEDVAGVAGDELHASRPSVLVLRGDDLAVVEEVQIARGVAGLRSAAGPPPTGAASRG